MTVHPAQLSSAQLRPIPPSIRPVQFSLQVHTIFLILFEFLQDPKLGINSIAA